MKMSLSPQVLSSNNLKDPSTYLQRPTSAKIPDVSHLLNSIFGDKYNREKLSADVVKNLSISSDVDNQYHKRYVQKLKEAQLVKENRIQEYAMLEKHILEAQAKALAYEDREEDKRIRSCQDPDNFGVPPTKSYFSYCIDDSILKDHNLLVPSDYYFNAKRPFVPMPKNPSQKYLEDTVSSRERSKHKLLPPIQSPRKFDIEELGDICIDGSSISDYWDDETNEKKKKIDKKLNTKPYWKETLRQEQRLNEKDYLKKLESRTNFLANPRLEATRLAQNCQEIDLVFEIIPKMINFNKYIIGKVYESTFEIRNTSTVAHQFRAIPPKSHFFSLSLGQYPQGQSLIAPGLSAQFNIRFSPDSLSSFEDKILVECSNGSKAVLPLVAKRESPCLTIGSVLNCGHSLVGQIKGCRFVIQNIGGDGRFVIFPKSGWPASTFKNNVLSTSLNVHPFEIQPSIFELRKDDIFVLEVVFKPADCKKYEQEIVITCDNCTTIEFKLIGEGKLAQIEYVESQEFNQDSQNVIAIDDFKDKISQKIIRFPNLNPKALTRKRFSLKNISQCPIDFSWVMYKPIFQDSLAAQTNINNTNYTTDPDTYFSILPKQGTLERDDNRTFEIVFNPDIVGSFESVAHLILHGIPEINKQMMIDTQNSIHKTYLSKDDFNTGDFLSTSIELRGVCEPFQFTLDPPAIFVPGPIYMQSTNRKAFRLINMSICPINFSWKQVLDPHMIQVEPSYGEIAPKSYALMDVLITGLSPGKLIEDIACYVEYADEPIFLHVEANIKGPELCIKEAGVDFGLVRVGDTSISYITLENISNLPLKWSLECLDHQEYFEYPRDGELLPLESVQIYLSFRPNEEIILNSMFTVHVKDGNSLTFNCHGQSQLPKISFINSQIQLDELYSGVEKVFQIELANHSVLNANFVWQKPIGDDSSFCEVCYEQPEGEIPGRTITQCLARIKADKTSEINDLILPCYLLDTDETIYLTIKGIVKGISVEIFVSNDESYSRANLIDFDNVQIGSKSTRQLIFQNMSGIRTSVNLSMKKFKAYEKAEKRQLFEDPLKKTPSLIEKFKIENEYNGIGFGLEKSSFELPEFSSVTISLVAIANFWGSYEDTLSIQINGIDTITIVPVKINVLGSPIKLYTSKVVQMDDLSMVRFGTSTKGQNPVIRKVQIFNASVHSIDISWKIFLVKSPDHQLIDLNMVDEQIKEPYSNSSSLESNDTKNLSRNSSNLLCKNKFEPIEEVRESMCEYYYYSYEERYPLVNLKLTPHYGFDQDKDNQVFLLEKENLSIGPKEKKQLEITFNTHVDKCESYEAIFVGYLNLADHLVSGDGFSRKISFEKEPIIFKATACLESPNLVVEYENEDLSFVVSIGDLIDSETKSLKNDKILKNKIWLLNNSLSTVNFDLKVEDPFTFNDKTLITKSHHLKPKSKIECSIDFKFNIDFVSQLCFNNGSAIYESILWLNFAQNVKQQIPISVKTYAPQLTITADALNFGKSLVDQERQLQFWIRNDSFSSAVWSIRIDDCDSAFHCVPTQGFIESRQNSLNKCEQIINVYFKARQSKNYISKLTIETSPSYGTEPIQIELKGCGSFDQRLEAILNV